MPGRDAQPVAITTIGAARGATLAFALDGRVRVAVIVKATFALADGLPMIGAEPQAIAERDVHPEGDTSRSLLVASDLVPYRAKADVTLGGSACAPAGAPASRVSVRFMVGRGQTTLLDKRLVALGPLGAGGAAAGPAPFTSVPLLWELAAKGPSNPAGTPLEAWPRICDAWSRPGPIGVGPIPAAWPTRRAFGVSPVVEGGVMRLPNHVQMLHDHVHQGFPWDYFQCAPPDQRVEYLHGDEWIVLEGLAADKPRLQSMLPNVRVAARATGDPKNPIGEGVQLVADTLHVDAENRLASVVWRGSFAVESEAALSRYAVFAKVLSDAPHAPAASKSAVPSSSGPRSRRKHDRMELKLSETLAPETRPVSTKPAISQTFVGAVPTAPAAAMPFEGGARPPSVPPNVAPDLSATPFARSSKSALPIEFTQTAASGGAQSPPLPFSSAPAEAARPPLSPPPPQEAVEVDVPPRQKRSALNSTMAFDPKMLEKLSRANSPMPFAAVAPSEVDPGASRNEQSRSPSPLPFVAAVRAPSSPPVPPAAVVPASSPPAPPPAFVAPPPLMQAPAPPVPLAPPRIEGAFTDPATFDEEAPSTKPVIAPPKAATPFAAPSEGSASAADGGAAKEAPKLGAAFLAAMARAGKKPGRPLQRRG